MRLIRIPTPALRPFVRLLWACEETAAQAEREHVLPSGGMHVVFRLSDHPLRVFAGADDDRGRTFELAVVGDVLTFTGDTITITSSKRGEEKATFRSDPRARLKTIDISPRPAADGLVVLGIYEFRANSLWLCFARPDQPRPTEFKTVEGTDTVLVVLKRSK